MQVGPDQVDFRVRLIGGRSIQSELDLRSSGKEEKFKLYIMSDDEAIRQLENALALQKKAFLKNQWPSVEERKANVGKIASMLLTNRDSIREAMAKDFGSHPTATSDLEVLWVAGRAAYVVSQIEKWTAVDSRDIDPQMYGAK